MKRIINFFLPKEEVFFDLLKSQASVACRAGTLFGRFLRDYNELSLASKRKRVKQIIKVEHEADKLTHEIVGLLHKTFITPIDREDIHELTHLLDDLVDLMDEISSKLIQFEVERIPRHLFNLCAVSLKSLNEVYKAVSHLRKPAKIHVFLRKIHDLEDEGDKIFYDAISDLFKKEKDAIKVIKFKDLYERTETLLDKTQDVAIVIEGIVVKHA
jgi:hypothetical protein